MVAKFHIFQNFFITYPDVRISTSLGDYDRFAFWSFLWSQAIQTMGLHV